MQHQWHNIAVGRVCLNCGITQAKAEFDDDVECHASTTPGVPPLDVHVRPERADSRRSRGG